MMKRGRIKKYLKIGVKLKIIWKKTRVLKIEILQIKFKNWNFKKIFENGSFEN